MFNFYKNQKSLKKINKNKSLNKDKISIIQKSLLNKKKKIVIKNSYVLYIRSSLRGFHINISTSSGKVLKVFSTGLLGYKKAQRYNQISLVSLSEEVLKFFKSNNNNKYRVNIVLKGFNSKRKRLVNLFFRSFLNRSIVSIIDLTDLPYNGCRPKKLRRK